MRGGEHHCRVKPLQGALALSLAAAAVIEALLYKTVGREVEVLFEPPLSWGLAMLGALALGVYGLLLRYTSGDPVIRILGAAGIGLAAAGVGLSWKEIINPETGAWLVVGAYFMELGVALRLWRYLAPLSRLWSLVFLGGAGTFILSLPLVVVLGGGAIVVPLAGNLVKAVGLTGLLALSSRECRDTRG